jgi:CubicO group peptidase (beta-lactamase class C family)
MIIRLSIGEVKMTEERLVRSTSEEQGISSAALLKFVDVLDKDIHEMHSLMLLRHGKVIAEGWWHPYRPASPHMLFSLSKSFTSTAVGLAVAEGLLSVDDKVVSFFPRDLPAEVSENLAAMRVRHLLSMSSGHDQDTTGRIARRRSKNWVKSFLSLPVEHAPGTHWVYNSGNSYILSAIVQKVTGMKLIDYLQPRLFEPLGIQGATWEISPQGINMGGWGLNVVTEDIACFGQLYLQKGKWNRKRILTEAWVEEATASHIANDRTDSDWHQGYGYQFWRCQHNAYRGDGAFGQYCIVMPEQDAVLAITSAVDDMQAVLNQVWAYLLPAFEQSALPADASARATLAQRLSGLALLSPYGVPYSPLAAGLSGKTYLLEHNRMKIEAVSFEFGTKESQVVVRDNDGEHAIVCRPGEWTESRALLFGGQPAVSVTSGAWISTDTFLISLRWYETPFYNTYSCRFKDGRVLISTWINVSFGPKKGPTLRGKLS